jgi:RecA/RadA recombinase
LIYGEPETGKTAVAMQCAINCAEQRLKTLFVDCDGSFSAQRLSQIAGQNFEKTSELLILIKPNSFREQTIVIDRLLEYVTKNFGLVVFDTITSLYRLKIAESPNKAFDLNREINRQMGFLAQVARTQKIAIITTSQVRTAFKEDYVSVEPVGTRVLKFWADTIIALKPTENAQIIKAVIEKTPTRTASTECYLKIDRKGISDYSE